MNRVATPASLALLVGILLFVVLTVACLVDDYGLGEALAWSSGAGFVGGLLSYFIERRAPNRERQTLGSWVAGLAVIVVIAGAVVLGLRAIGVDRDVSLIAGLLVVASLEPTSYLRRHVFKH
jgi:hypothetical protein